MTTSTVFLERNASRRAPLHFRGQRACGHALVSPCCSKITLKGISRGAHLVVRELTPD